MTYGGWVFETVAASLSSGCFHSSLHVARCETECQTSRQAKKSLLSQALDEDASACWRRDAALGRTLVQFPYHGLYESRKLRHLDTTSTTLRLKELCKHMGNRLSAVCCLVAVLESRVVTGQMYKASRLMLGPRRLSNSAQASKLCSQCFVREVASDRLGGLWPRLAHQRRLIRRASSHG